MAPTKSNKKPNKTSGKKPGATRDSKNRVSKPSSSSKSRSKSGPAAPPKEQKSKRPGATGASPSGKSAKGGKQRRHYTEKELGIPTLNTVTPVGVQKPGAGRKKGKVFVDDASSMLAIMAVVNAEKEGQIESKMLRTRQLEEIRRLKREEQEERERARKEKLEDTKDSLRRKRRRTTGGVSTGEGEEVRVNGAKSKSDGGVADASKKPARKKRVSFG